MRWLLLLLAVVLLLALSCSPGSNPVGPIPNASLFFDLGGPTLYIVNGGQGTAYQVHLYRIYGGSNHWIDNFANRDSMVTLEKFGFSVTYDTLEADWTNPNGTTGRFKEAKP